MNAPYSPHASGPPPPRQDHVPKGANPLRRTSDRVESWLGGLLLLALVLGLPVAAIGAGLTAYDASMQAVRTQAEQRQEVTARLTSVTEGVTTDVKQPAHIRWTDADGVVRTGTTLVKAGTPAGATVKVWTDRDTGSLTRAPLSEHVASVNGWFAGSVAAAGVGLGYLAARAGTRRLLDRGRYAQWDAEWARVEPLWSGRHRC
ncbi:hypothetical protein MTQ10_25530 [Streptomyces sp. XM83C]|jgi:hypothetical protein|uniref:Uncharacterized protein n=1 Tax=Streptomyces thermocoprophilus TaxID=78356 RepID=A0ABV5V6Y4_9ACTN|nr:hypothetical protein [Streptomyces sp. XM83C]MCK1822868.1 hypothetical protein [Streptomyces sp. XM83C]